MKKIIMKGQMIKTIKRKTTHLITIYRHPMKRFQYKFSTKRNKIMKIVHNKMVIIWIKNNPTKLANRHLLQLHNKKINTMSIQVGQ